MLQAIMSDGTLHWQCHGGEKDDHCLVHLTCHASEAVYQLPQEAPDGRGAVIALPPCGKCGAQCSLKADYTLRELFRETLTWRNKHGDTIGYILPLQHLHNLLLHYWLHTRGKAAYAPILEPPTRAEINHPCLASLPGIFVLMLWFGYKAIQAVDPRLESFDMVLREIEALPIPTITQEVPHGTP